MRSAEAHGKFFQAQIDSQAAVFKAAGVAPGKAE